MLNPNNPLNKPIALSNLFWIILVLVLIAGNIFLGVKYLDAQKKLRQTQTILKTQQTNDKVLSFTKLFIKKVLKAEKEVDFETRLELEKAVRDLNDQEVLSQWQRFVNSQSENEAQQEVKNLLEMLIDKINIPSS